MTINSVWRSARPLTGSVIVLALAGAGCGGSHPASAAAGGLSPAARPQAVEPTAGVQASTSRSATEPVGDPSVHAPPLREVKRELSELNLCGGATNTADAHLFTTHAGPGFVADPGTQQTEGQLPELTAQLNALAKALGVTIYGISGYRTPAHSVAVGGYADDPHTKGEAEDIGVNSQLRISAAGISEAELAKFGLYRPFDPSGDAQNSEVNHVQLIPAGGELSAVAAQSTLTPDPLCKL